MMSLVDEPGRDTWYNGWLVMPWEESLYVWVLKHIRFRSTSQWQAICSKI